MSKKSLVFDSLMSLPILLLYLLFINKLIEILVSTLDAKDKIKKHLLYSFVIGVCGIVLAIYIFDNSGIKNRSVKIALSIGSAIIIINSFIINWDQLDQDVKLFMLGGILVLTVLFTYLKQNS